MTIRQTKKLLKPHTLYILHLFYMSGFRICRAGNAVITLQIYLCNVPNSNKCKQTYHGGCSLPVSMSFTHYSSYKGNIHAESQRRCSEYFLSVVERRNKRLKTLFFHLASGQVHLYSVGQKGSSPA